MYIIMMNKDKQLISSVWIPIYRGENMSEDVKFLLPLTYKKYDLSEFTATLQYIRNQKIVYEEPLVLDNPSYRPDRLSFSLQLNSIFTQVAGQIQIQLRITKADIDAGVQYILKSSSCYINILPSFDYDTGEEPEETINSKLEEMDAKLALMNATLATKADDIMLDPDSGEIVLSSSGTKVGSSICAKDLGETIVNHSDEGLINVLI